jgi:hypothetical protein
MKGKVWGHAFVFMEYSFVNAAVVGVDAFTDGALCHHSHIGEWERGSCIFEGARLPR